MKNKIAVFPYANVGPYLALGQPAGCEFYNVTPKASTVELREGRAVAGLVPVGDLPGLMQHVEYLGEYGISAAGEVDSVLLFSDCRIKEMSPEKTLRLTDHSASSVRLLYLLLGREIGFDRLPRAVGPKGPANGHLLIGDKALLYSPENTWPHVTDLSAEWMRSTRRPFVFARWVVRRDAPASVKRTLTDWLNRFASVESSLVKSAAVSEAARLGLSEEKTLRYLQKMKRVLGSEEIKGQALFLEQLAKNERDTLFAPVSDMENNSWKQSIQAPAA